MNGDEVFVYSVDRVQRGDLRHYDVLPEWAQTAWHRARPDDEGLAACNSRIVLNVEDQSDIGNPCVGRLCRRCFPSQRPVQHPTEEG